MTGSSECPVLYRESTDPAIFHKAVWGDVFNARRDLSRIPRAVVRATSTSHVVQAIDLAAKLGVRVSVRSGGHSWAAWSVRDDAILIDLAGLPGSRGFPGELEFDEKNNVVSCPPGCTSRSLNAFLASKGRFFAGGHCPDVGMGGFLLQGGMGWNVKVGLSLLLYLLPCT
jgi:FAD/FMN-containing dehydrogenase